MELREIRSLSLLAACGSIVETARQMNVTPAAVHKQLKHLADELQATLYEKRGNRLRLTAGAEILLPYFRDILTQQESSVVALEEWKGVRRGSVRIGSGPSLAANILPPILYAFSQKWPGVKVDIQSGSSAQHIDSLQAGKIDLAIVVARELGEGAYPATALKLRFEVILVSCLPKMPKQCSLLELARFPFMMFRRGTWLEGLIDRYFEKYSFQPNIMMRFDSAEAMKATLVSGMGVSILPSYAVAREISSGALRQIRQTQPPLTMDVRILVRNAGFVSPAMRAFISTARETAGPASK